MTLNYWDKTISVYGKIIDYPTLTEKYLKRPPFKYILQIFLSLSNKTGFMKGRLTKEEESSDYYDSPEKKMNFLKTVFKEVYSLIDKPMHVKPQSIIKGIESNKVNEFLQDLLKASQTKSIKPSEPSSTTSLKDKKSDSAHKKDNIHVEPFSQKSIELETLHSTEHRPEFLNKLNEKESSSKKSSYIEELKRDKEREANILRGNSSGVKMGTLKPSDSMLIEKPELAFQNTMLTLKDKIQSITKLSGPLGTLIDFVEDDLEEMSKEYKKWLKVYKESKEALEDKESKEEEEMRSFIEKRYELDEKIEELNEKIRAARSRVIQNNQKIQQNLSNIIS